VSDHVNQFAIVLQRDIAVGETPGDSALIPVRLQQLNGDHRSANPDIHADIEDRAHAYISKLALRVWQNLEVQRFSTRFGAE
jgi:hypothetical protein